MEDLARASATLSSGRLREIINQQFPGRQLVPKQVSNMSQKIKFEAKDQTLVAGSDSAGLMAELERLREEDLRWRYTVMLSEDNNNQPLAIFWQDPRTVQLARAYGDIIVDDIGNIVTVIDNNYQNRNTAYAVQISEATAFHS